MLTRMITRAIRGTQYRAGVGRGSRGIRSHSARAHRRANGPRLRRERSAAAAGRFRVRVEEAEPGAVQAVGKVERHPVEEQVALAIDENADALLLVNLVLPGGLLLERQLVRHAGAAASDDRDPEAVVQESLILHDGLDLLGRLVRDVNHRSSFEPFTAWILRHRRAPWSTAARSRAASSPRRPPGPRRSPLRPAC